jgi:hypothetical protein
VDKSTIYRWLKDGFIEGEQLTPAGPWQLHITDELRPRVVPEVPEGWMDLARAAKALGVARVVPWPPYPERREMSTATPSAPAERAAPMSPGPSPPCA